MGEFLETTGYPDDSESRSLDRARNSGTETVTLALYAEDLAIARRTVAGRTVRVASVTRERDQLIDETLTHERVEIDRVAVGRTIDAVPPVREEGDTTIIPIVDEVIVVERRLVLKEEVRIRRVRVTEHHRESVVVREQDAVITRHDAPTEALGNDRRVSGAASTQPAEE